MCVDGSFPFSKPEVVLRDTSYFMKIPHVEKSGRVCVMPSHGTLAPNNPGGVVLAILDDVAQLISDGLSGRNHIDFLDEYESYWSATAEDADAVLALLEPTSPSREIFFWRCGELLLFAEDEDVARTWLKRVFRGEDFEKGRTGKTILIWRDEAIVPEHYPRTNFDIAQLAENSRPCVLRELIMGIRDFNARNLPVLLCFGTNNGPGLVALDLTIPLEPTARGKTRPARVAHGFRSIEKTPLPVLGQRYLARSGRVIRKKCVQRVDPEWMLNRGGDGFGALYDKHVVIIGCGSIGAAVAWQLAQAGVGQLTLVDFDIYSWDNAARHILAGSSVGMNKAEAVAAHIMSQMPHVDAAAHKTTWEDVWRGNEGTLQAADLIVSSTGAWESELALNVLKKSGVLAPPLLFLWSEAHALAGHSLLVASNGGCLACGMGATGTFRKRALEWDDEEDKMKRVPACGGYFQPYGVINISAIRRMGSEHAIHVLLGGDDGSSIRSWVSSGDAIAQKKGRLRAEYCAFYGGNICGDQVLRADWPSERSCLLCAET